MQFDAMFLGNGFADGRSDLGRIQAGKRLPSDLTNHDETFFALHFDCEGSTGIHLQGRVAGFDRRFDVLRIMVPTANDENVFEAAGDEKLAIFDETQIACP